MENDVTTMTDADLLAACRKQPWERRMAGVGCGPSLAVGVLTVYGIFRLLGGFAWPLGIIVLVNVSGLAEYRSRGDRRVKVAPVMFGWCDPSGNIAVGDT